MKSDTSQAFVFNKRFVFCILWLVKQALCILEGSLVKLCLVTDLHFIYFGLVSKKTLWIIMSVLL